MTERPAAFRINHPAHALVLGVIALFLTPPNSVSAQVIQGHLYDTETGEPVINGTVVLLKDLGTVVARTEADSVGAYSLIAPGLGMYSLRATGLGYISTPTLQFDVGEEGSVTVNVYLHPEPIELDSLLVEAERQRILPHLETQGFYRRLEEGFGSFITPEEIEKRNPRYFGDLFRNIIGVRFRADGTVDLGPRCGRSGGQVWLDGGLTVKGLPLMELVNISDIQAVEVYRSVASIPIQFAGAEGGCAIIIWTKGGG